MVRAQLRVILCVIFASFFRFDGVKSNMFTAIAEMDRILKVENEVAQDLRSYVDQEEERLKYLKK